MTIKIIVAMDDNNGIGKDNQLMWNIKEDMKHFRDTTMGKTIVMGRKTFESIGKPLKGRKNIVLTSSDRGIEDVWIANSVESILNYHKPSKEDIYIIGGEQIYKSFIPHADKLIVTHVQGSYDADTYFPKIDIETWKEYRTKIVKSDTPITISYYKRK